MQPAPQCRQRLNMVSDLEWESVGPARRMREWAQHRSERGLHTPLHHPLSAWTCHTWGRFRAQLKAEGSSRRWPVVASIIPLYTAQKWLIARRCGLRLWPGCSMLFWRLLNCRHLVMVTVLLETIERHLATWMMCETGFLRTQGWKATFWPCPRRLGRHGSPQEWASTSVHTALLKLAPTEQSRARAQWKSTVEGHRQWTTWRTCQIAPAVGHVGENQSISCKLLLNIHSGVRPVALSLRSEMG